MAVSVSAKRLGHISVIDPDIDLTVVGIDKAGTFGSSPVQIIDRSMGRVTTIGWIQTVIVFGLGD